MTTRLLGLILTAPLLLASANAQTKPAGAPAQATKQAAAPAANVTNDGQWEYLVISFGKTYFSSPTDIAAKQTGQSKLMIFGPLGGVVAQEALDTQQQVDTLGRYGWELIGVLGAIGGDQQWVFKRPFDPDRAAKEAAQVKKEGAELAAARDKAAKEAASKPVTPPPAPPTELVELDSREAQAKQAAANKAIQDDTSRKLTLTGWPLAKFDVSDLRVSTYNGRTSIYGTATINLDVTQRALSGNTYRRSNVEAILEEYLNALKSQGRSVVKSSYSFCDDDSTAFKIAASIKFNNEWKEVVYPSPSSTYCLK